MTNGTIRASDLLTGEVKGRHDATTNDGWNVPLLEWFKNDFMKWTPKDPICKICVNRRNRRSNVIEGCSNDRSVADAAQPTMQAKRIIA